MAVRAYLVGALFVLLTYRIVQAQWSGQYYHMRDDPDYYEVGYVCRFWFFWCWSWRTVWYVRYNPVYRCCPGWSHNGNRNCNVPVCNPRCMNGGTCRGASSPNCFKFRGYCSCSPNTCSCPAGSFGVDCANTSCSHLAPCYPGNCVNTNGCRCAGGFKSISSILKQHCLNIDYDQNGNADLKIYQMQVRMSYWPHGKNPPEEKYRLLTDSTHLKENEMDFQWTNQKDFNRLETTCSSQFFTLDLPPKPRYIGRTVMGVVKAEAKIELSKRPAYPETQRFYSLNGTVPCPTLVSLLNPEPGLYECNITNPNFDRFLEHGDFLKVTYVTQGGGFRELLVLNSWHDRPIENQTFTGGTKNLSVEFRFDFEAPHHCGEKKACHRTESILKVPEITKTSPLRISWTGWQDDDSGVYRYAMEVFKMTKGPDGDLEIKPTEALNPLIIRELYASNLTAQQYEPPEPGMYSILLEVADLANNTKYARRLCLYDPTSAITNDPDHDLFVRSASEAANYSYQSDKTAPILVTWDKHFRNAFHEDNNLLGPVRPYPPSLEGHKKNIPQTTELEDLQGEITINGVRNVRGIVMFRVAYTKDHDGGLKQLDQPPGPWKDLDLETKFTVPLTPSEGDTVTIWVKATDAMGNEKRERTKVTFDSTPPNVQDPVFKMNNIVPGISFSSTFEIIANDDQSGIAYIQWTFQRQNGTIIHQEKVPGKRATKEECQKYFTKCRCTPTDECFWFDQLYSFSNCHMMVEKENLETEVITVTADVTNMAGIVTSMSLTTSNLTMLNGTEAYFPPQNIKVISITDTGVTLTWDFPPSCFKREELWVIVGDKQLKVHKDANQFDLSGLDSKTSYVIYMQTVYEGGVRSDNQPLVFFTAEAPISAATIVGIVIGVLLLLAILSFILIFVLWRKGVILQKEGRINSQLKRFDGAFQSVRRMTRRGRPSRPRVSHLNKRSNVEEGPDEIYMYGEMTFNARQPWQLSADSLTLVDHVIEGKFANIYRATWLHDDKRDTVAVKMPKPGFTEDDSLKMMAKINFFATQLEDHENVIRFVGAVTDNATWGPVMVMEYCDNGQMDKWLASHKDRVGEQLEEDLMHFSLGVAKGMEYLASKGITHRRLAARNVLLCANLEVRVAGFGPQQKEGAEEKTREKIPAKWAAPEVLRDEPSTEKSDVWSYGVVLWEIFSLGEVPYPNFHSNEIGTRLKGGYRMPKPELADTIYHDIMKECWQYKPGKRPTFKTIRARLEQHFNPGSRQSVDFYYDTNQLKPPDNSA